MDATSLNELETLLAAARDLHAHLEGEAADLLLACRLRVGPAPGLRIVDDFDHAVATLYAPTSVLARLEADEDLRGRIRQALDTVHPAHVCIDALELRSATDLLAPGTRPRDPAPHHLFAA